MKENDRGLKHRALTQEIIGVFYEVYNELGHGFLESVYETALEIALTSKGLPVLRQIEVPVWFRGKKIGDFTADMLVDRCVLLELKAGRALDPAHEAQLLNYLRATEIEVGMLFSFGLKPEFKRLAFDNARKQGARRPSLLETLLSTDAIWPDDSG
ncbi:MAG TPA: GxxExxY protein [Pyrinomonadaceae bacterium]|nr:GxxExxY protein [Pyrinomonadaceae bacterium]